MRRKQSEAWTLSCIMVGTFLVFIIIMLLMGKAKADTVAPPNFHRVVDGVFRGGQPVGLAGMAWLKDRDIATILDLNDDNEEYIAESNYARMAGINLIYMPLSGWQAPPQWVMDEVEGYMADPVLRPLYVHCEHGQDRTGLAVGLYRVKTDHWSRDRAHEEMMEMGFHPILLGLEWAFWNE